MPLFDDQQQIIFYHRFPTHIMYWIVTESKNTSEFEEEFLQIRAAFRDREGVVWFIDATLTFFEGFLTATIDDANKYYNSTVIELK